MLWVRSCRLSSLFVFFFWQNLRSSPNKWDSRYRRHSACCIHWGCTILQGSNSPAMWFNEATRRTCFVGSRKVLARPLLGSLKPGVLSSHLTAMCAEEGPHPAMASAAADAEVAFSKALAVAFASAISKQLGGTSLPSYRASLDDPGIQWPARGSDGEG